MMNQTNLEPMVTLAVTIQNHC